MDEQTLIALCFGFYAVFATHFVRQVLSRWAKQGGLHAYLRLASQREIVRDCVDIGFGLLWPLFVIVIGLQAVIGLPIALGLRAYQWLYRQSLLWVDTPPER